MRQGRMAAGAWLRIAMGLATMMIATMAPVGQRDASAQAGPSLEIVSPAAGGQVTTDDIEVQVKVSDFTVDCTKTGTPDEDGIGHIHAMIDGMTMASLTNFYCQEQFTISGEGLAPGTHTLIVDLASNTHMDMMGTAKQVEIDFQPANARPLPAANDQGEPGLELVSPERHAEVDARFTIEVTPNNFTPSANLEGKQNVPGYGHYHVFIDTPMMSMASEGTPEAGMDAMASPEAGMDGMSMMSMAGMVAMPGANTFELDLTAWGPGEHVIWIEPVQNDHTIFERFGHVEFRVNVT